MKRAYLYSGTLLLLVLFFACKKNTFEQLPEGSYTGNFYGHSVKVEDGTYSEFEKNDLNVMIEVASVTDTSININGRTLYRNGDIIEGVIGVGDGSGGYYIGPLVRGICSKEKGVYYIRGSYNALSAVPWPVSGTFEIKSNF